MSNDYLKPSFIPPYPPENLGRRKVLIAASAAASAVGAGFVAVPFLSTWLPSERAKAIGAPVTVDFTKLAEGALQTALWQGKVVYILRRTPEMLATLDQLTAKLRDPDSNESIQPENTKNEWRSVKKEIAIMFGVCTHLGCAPKLQSKEQGYEERADAEWLGGFFCPCHGSEYDYAGRVYKGVPAPTNLSIPPYYFKSDTVVVVGEGEKLNG